MRHPAFEMLMRFRPAVYGMGIGIGLLFIVDLISVLVGVSGSDVQRGALNLILIAIALHYSFKRWGRVDE